MFSAMDTISVASEVDNDDAVEGWCADEVVAAVEGEGGEVTLLYVSDGGAVRSTVGCEGSILRSSPGTGSGRV
jgi:hypothetical protein